MHKSELNSCMHRDEKSLPGAGTKLVLGDLFLNSTRLLAQTSNRFWCRDEAGASGMKLVGGVDGDETGLIVGLLLRLIPAPMEETGDGTKGDRRWRRRAGWSLCVFVCLSSFLLLVLPLIRVRIVSTEKKWLLLLWDSVEAGLGLR